MKNISARPLYSRLTALASFVPLVPLVLTLCLCLSPGDALAASKNITSAAAARIVAAPPPDLVILDVRTANEFAMGHIPGAINVDFFGKDFEEALLKMDRGKPYILYCRSGNRSAGALDVMEKMGFSDVNHMADGFQQWRKEEHPVQH